MSKLPVSDGLIGNWDYKLATSSIWKDSAGEQTINLRGATISDTEECVYLNKNAFAYMPYAIGNNATLYFIAKAVCTTTMSGGISWGFALCGADSNHRVFCGLDMNGSNWVFFSSSSVKTASYGDWGILAFTVKNGKQILYFNGVAVASFDRAVDFNFKGLYINAGAYNGAAPSNTGGFGEDIYIKHVALFNAAHNADDVKRNTAYLQQLYFGETSIDSIKARAIALGFMIGYNKATAQALANSIDSYRQGILDGDNGNGNVNEDYTTDDSSVDIGVNADDTGSTEPAATDMSKGYFISYGDPTTKEPTGYVKIYIEPYYHKSNMGSIRKNKIIAVAYDSDGAETGRKECDYQFENDGFERTDTLQNIRINSGSSISTFHWVHYYNPNITSHYGNDFMQQTTYTLSDIKPSGSYLNVTNVNPF